MILLLIFADLFSCKIKFSNYFFGYQSQFLASEIILSLSILLGQERSYSFYLASFDLGYKYKVGCQDFFQIIKSLALMNQKYIVVMLYLSQRI